MLPALAAAGFLGALGTLLLVGGVFTRRVLISDGGELKTNPSGLAQLHRRTRGNKDRPAAMDHEGVSQRRVRQERRGPSPSLGSRERPVPLPNVLESEPVGLTPAHPRPGWLGAGLVLLVLGAGLEVGWTLLDLGFLTPGDALAYLTTTGPGRAALTWVMGGALLLAAELSAWPAVFALLSAAVLLWGAAGTGHGGSHGPVTRGLTALHLGAMAVWLGGVLALLGLPAPTPALARRFTPVALGCVGVLMGSGALLTVRHAGDLLALPGSLYGRTLLVKLGLVVLALLAAAFVRRAFARRRGVRRHLALETLLLLGVLGVTAALGTTPPPTHAGHSEAGLPLP